MKFVIVSGGTVSGLGKGTAISSLGVVLKAYGYPVTAIKIDPYLNIDAGTMSPYEHGEVFVLEDGGEGDLDLGNYERFLDVKLTKDHNITSGKIYSSVIAKERQGGYLGKTVQMVPHVTDAVQDWILRVAKEAEQRDTSLTASNITQKELIVLIELGGTVGDIESAVYLEAIQQFQYRIGVENVCNIHVGFVPMLGVVGEQKTKPCQHSVKLLREAGIKPDFLFCRSESPLEEDVRKKLSLFCQTSKEHVISLHDVKNSYRVPMLLHEQHCGEFVLKRLGLDVSIPADLTAWMALADRAERLLVSVPKSVNDKSVRIAIVGKYTGLSDSYLSVIKALQHAALEANVHLTIEWFEATELEDPATNENVLNKLRGMDGILVPGGFGDRGVEGKIACARFCLNEGKPYFGICLGLQTAVICVARDRLHLSDANSAEFSPTTSNPVVIFMPEGSKDTMGGTMRLGSRICRLHEHSLAYKLYGGKKEITERHRHRYEVNPDYVSRLESEGALKFSGIDIDQVRMEIAEIPSHPFFIACQAHPEFTSRPKEPNPLFLGFVLASAGKLHDRLNANNSGVLNVGDGWNM